MLSAMIQPNPDFLAHFSSDNSVDRAAADKAEVTDLVIRANAGDAVAQAELVQRYRRRLGGFVRTIVRQSAAIEDVTQMVFIKMFRRLGRLRDPSVFEAWLFTLARNTCLDHLRRCRCRPNTVALEDEEINTIPDPSNGDASAEILAALDRALQRLPALDRSLVSQFVAGDSYSTIANRTGLSLATVKVRLHRVRPFLRSWVGEMTETRQPGGKGWRRVAGARMAA